MSSLFKKQYHSGLKLYWDMKSGKKYYEIDGVEDLRQRHNKLVDIVNGKG